MSLKYFFLSLASIFLLAGCQSKYTVEVELNDQQKQALMSEIETKQKEMIELKQKEEGDLSNPTIDIARDYETLGQLDKSIETYINFIDQDLRSTRVHHNLGRLYEKVKEYNKAAEQYQILVDDFSDISYLRDISLVYIKAQKPEKAQQYLDQWKQLTGETDDFTQQRINKLKK